MQVVGQTAPVRVKWVGGTKRMGGGKAKSEERERSPSRLASGVAQKKGKGKKGGSKAENSKNLVRPKKKKKNKKAYCVEGKGGCLGCGGGCRKRVHGLTRGL